MTNPTHCPICRTAATLKCAGCKSVVYCGKEHQKIHWKKGHKAECKCYEVATNDVLGRHLIATRDIKRGEIILREQPFIYGPKVACHPLCLGCHRQLSAPPPGEKNFYKCSKCSWPLCGAQCEKSPHHLEECQLMAEKKFGCKIDYSKEPKKESAYCVILPLRCILMKLKKPDAYKRLMELEDHLNERLETPYYNVLRANLVTFIKTCLGFKELDENEILRIAATLDTNAFEIRQPSRQVKVRGLYPKAAMISHDCISNARHAFDDNMQIVFLAKTQIKKGDIIATSYTQPLKSTILRRLHLKQAKCFDCSCQRCVDPWEMDTFAGAILCSKCKVGKIVSTNPLDNEAVWRCLLCPHEITAKQIIWGNNAMMKEIESLDKTSPKQFEEFIYRYRETLHEKNTHVLQVKYALTQLYGNVPGFYLHELCDAAVKRKLELCQELLEIADIFDPGWSIFRGNLLLDMQEVMVIQAKRDYANDLLTISGTQEKLQEAMEMLKEAVEILKFEPEMKELLQKKTEALSRDLEMD
ncbi:SET domain-containing protein SmydA-8 [Eupeodes corollae]|uniref:SET domain-containing protein SmydA-8 n=1 Tax=Eupeodes corollae TaxID=290404 RepID=UPI002493215F|nr:SET domain-containing protein SmydA-8 [Eupeodes corollae]